MRLFVLSVILCFMVPTTVSTKSNSIWWGISLHHHFTQTCQGQVTVGLSPTPPAAAATHLPPVGDTHYLCSPHHCSDGLCRDNNTPFNLLNDYNCKKTTAFAATGGFHFQCTSATRVFIQTCSLFCRDSLLPYDEPTHLRDELVLQSNETSSFLPQCLLWGCQQKKARGSICPKVRYTLQYPDVK